MRTSLGRHAERGDHSLASALEILDSAVVGHIGFSDDTGGPVVIPVAVAPDHDQVLFHGSTGSRMFRTLAGGAPLCLTVTHVDGLVLARSAFESSMNYRSLVVFGQAEELAGPAKERALRILTEHLTPGRWDALRPMRGKEIAATMVLAVPLTEFSVKSRTGGPEDGDEAQRLIWAGEIPLVTTVGAPKMASDVPAGQELPERWLAVAPVRGAQLAPGPAEP